MTFDFDFDFIIKYFPVVLSYVDKTIFIAVAAMAGTLVFSLIITAIRYYKVKVLTPIVNIYIDIFRGTPLLVQLFFMYFGLAQFFTFFRDMPAINAAILGLALNASAYTTENMRSALESIPKGQTEAGLSVGMTKLQVLWHIVLPQAAKVAVPTLTNDFIALIKNSSMAFTLGVRDMMGEASILANNHFRFFEGYMIAFIIYFVLCKIANYLQRYIEKRLNVPEVAK